MKKTEPNQFDHGSVVVLILIVVMLLLYMADGCHSASTNHIKEVSTYDY